ncbi:glycoside hydrolase [Microthyrium microscopicum]|uniref:glucan 1,3-beta-glucosidase n=1 Tax=Microthyrium microscopicum TaxID=703497 RepID=A0A6A6UFD0_9PEZI|nr:glycoside hydrolase [Microthyrium microscopicum]
MPNNERRRSRDPSADPEGERARRPRRPSDLQRRKGHRATDSQGELLPKARYRSESRSGGTSSTPRRSRRDDSSSGEPLSLDKLARLDAVNAKQEKKRGWQSYDEAYLAEVREREAQMEEDRRKEERRLRKAEARERTRREEQEDEEERLRAEAKERRREERRKRRDSERVVEEEKGRQARIDELKKSRRPKEVVDASPKTPGRVHEDWRRKQSKYQKLEDRGTPEPEERLEKTKKHKKSRIISGPYVEDGRAEKVYKYEKSQSRKNNHDVAARRAKIKKWAIIAAVVLLLILIIAIPAAVVANKKKNAPVQSAAVASTGRPSNSNLNGISQDSIPASAKGGYLDPFTWYDTIDFNVTYTNDTIGGLPLMGLNSTWDDSVAPNSGVPALKDSFAYGSMPIRGMSLGGWLSIEPFITPSFFQKYNQRDLIIDEWTLTTKLGTQAAPTLEAHYSAFINKQAFADIRAAGFDHVRIPFSYWAVTTYSGDPYVAKISWRYLLRGIEYARQNGLRVNLDLHAVPGSQNGWNHSGRQGSIGWLNGTDGDLNAQRTLDIHNQLTAFFAQPRYTNIITLYGLVNEPRMVFLDTTKVTDWINKAVAIARGNKMKATIVFGDGFLGLDNWKGKLQTDSNMLLDVHQYVIFNNAQIVLKHTDKLNFACKGWTAQMTASQNKATGFGPTMCGEWSQADTDCAQYINDVFTGSRWEGTLNVPPSSTGATAVLTPQCPTKSSCECSDANADPSKYSAAYKQWLLYFALAQMDSFEQGWGWFYWTWITENAPQWSWKLGMQAGILPKTVQDRSFTCNSSIPDFGGMGLSESY